MLRESRQVSARDQAVLIGIENLQTSMVGSFHVVVCAHTRMHEFDHTQSAVVSVNALVARTFIICGSSPIGLPCATR